MFDSTISDNELRDLLRQVVLSGEENDSLTEKMIDMERNAVFATTPLVAVSLVKETAFLSQLKGGVAVKTALKFGLNMKWLFGGLGTLCVATTGLVVYNATNQQPNEPQNNKPALTANTTQNSKDTSAFFIATPSDTFGFTPTPPVRENVTEQTPEVLLFAEETIIEFPVADPPAKGKRHARRLARTLKKLERLSDAPLPDAYGELEDLPDLPELPDLPDLPELPELAELADLSEMPELPEIPEMPDFSMETMEMIDMERMAMMDELAAFGVYHEDSLLPATSFSNINKLEVNIDWGDIIVTKSPDQQVHIAERSANLGAEDNKGELSVFIQPVIHPETEEKQSRQTRSERKHACTNMAQESAPLQISVPDGVEIELKNSNGDIRLSGITSNKVILTADFGDIEVTDVNSALQATASSGDVKVHNVKGTIMARSYFGDLDVMQAEGATNLYSSSGNATVGRITGDLSVQSDFGDIGVTNISGRTIINGNSGNIAIDSIAGSQLKVNSNFGNVTIKHITAPSELMVNSGNLTVDETIGDLTVHSQFGEVTIDDVKGNLFVYGNSGNIDLSDLDGNLVVESVFGNVDFNDTKGNVTITANSGSVTGQDVMVKENLSVEVDFGDSDIELDNDANDLRFDVEATMGTASVSKGNLKLKKDEGHIVTEKGAITIKGVARSGSVSFD